MNSQSGNVYSNFKNGTFLLHEISSLALNHNTKAQPLHSKTPLSNFTVRIPVWIICAIQQLIYSLMLRDGRWKLQPPKNSSSTDPEVVYWRGSLKGHPFPGFGHHLYLQPSHLRFLPPDQPVIPGSDEVTYIFLLGDTHSPSMFAQSLAA